MSKYIVDSSLMTGIADNIRLKTGEEGNLVFPTGFNAAIESLPSIEDMRDIKDKVDDIKDIFDSNESEIDKTITTPVDIVSFSDGADDIPMALKVAVEPVQDLHGQSNPYPAGGGKNRFPITFTTQTKNGTTFTVASDGAITISGTPTERTRIALNSLSITLSADMKFSMTGSATGVRVFCRYNNSGAITYPTLSPSASLFTGATADQFTLEVNTTFTGTVTLKFQLENGTTVTDWVPYSNICPISGWTGANVWDDPAYAGTIRLNQIFPLKNGEYAGTNFTVSFDGAGCMTVDVTETASSTNANNMSSVGAGTWIKGHIYAYIGGAHGINLRLKNLGKDIDSVFKVDNPSYNNIAIVFTNLAVGVYKVYPMIIDLTAMFGEAKAEEILSLGSVAGAEYVKSLLPKEYYPYNVDGTETCISAVNGNPYRHIEVAFPSSAGTVYGGTLTVNKDGTGELVVDRASVVFSRNTGVSNNGSSSNYTWMSITESLPNGYSGNTTPNAGGDGGLFSHGEWRYSFGTTWRSFIPTNRATCIATLMSDKYDLTTTAGRASFWDWFESKGETLQSVYPLATPVTYELTDLEVIETLKGINNIWADTGKINEVEYSADSQLCITNKLNELDSLLSTYTETQA